MQALKNLRINLRFNSRSNLFPMMLTPVMTLVITLLINSCANKNLPKVETLSGFRVLALMATKPEIAQGETTVISFAISDSLGGGRAIPVTIETCIDPGISTGADISCDGDSTKTSSTLSINTETDANLGSTHLYTGVASNTFSYTPSSTSISTALGLASTEELYNGIDLLVIATFELSEGNVKSFKRIKLSTKSSSLQNTNPTINSISLNGQSTPSTRPSKEDVLTISTSTAESYQYYNVDNELETRTEKLEVAWYVTSGELSTAKATASESITYDSDKDTASNTFLLIALLRDERGGTAIKQLSL